MHATFFEGFSKNLKPKMILLYFVYFFVEAFNSELLYQGNLEKIRVKYRILKMHRSLYCASIISEAMLPSHAYYNVHRDLKR